MKKILMTIAFAICMTLTCLAQTKYEWKAFNMEFELPDGMEVTKSDETKFVAQNSDNTFALSLVPFEYEKLKGKKLGASLANLAYEDLKIDASTSETDDFECENGVGFYIKGPATDNTYTIVAAALSEMKQVAVIITVVCENPDDEPTGMEFIKNISFN
jgi:hypothetical protein